MLCVMRAASEYERNTFKILFAFSRLKFVCIRCELVPLERQKMVIVSRLSPEGEVSQWKPVSGGFPSHLNCTAE